jgi:glycosyltransferase involved in cell wall biosynthesis
LHTLLEDRIQLPRRILLNISPPELTLGGDSTHYKDYLQLSNEEIEFLSASPRWGRRARTFVNRAAGRACRTWEPARFRQRLLIYSRQRTLGDLRNVDAVFSHLWFPRFRTAQSPPIIWSSQGISPAAYYDYVNEGRVNLYDVIRLYKVLGERSDALIIYTQTCASNVVAALPELESKIHVIAPCVFLDPAAAKPKPSESDGIVRFLFVGMDAVRKGLRETLAAYELMRRRHSCVDLTIVSRQLPMMQAEGQGVTVLTSGLDTNVRRLMAQADVFVLPTHADTFAAAAVEAMGHGCAVIISDLEPLPEIVPNGEAGFVVGRGDVASLANRMSDLAGDVELLRRLQAGARRLYSIRNDPDIVRERIIRLVDDLVA